MTAYTPPAPSNGAAFAPSVIDGGFVDLATAINAALNDANVSKGVLLYRSFTPEALTTMRVGESFGEVDTCWVYFNSSGSANHQTVYGAKTNIYEPPHAGVAFYLHQTADVHFSAQLAYRKGKDSWLVADTGPAITALEYVVTGSLLLDGATTVATRTLEYRDITGAADLAGSASRRGFTMILSGVALNVAAGLHTAKVSLDFTGSSFTGGGAGPTYPQGTQFQGTARILQATALYL